MEKGKEVPNVNFMLEFCLPNYPNNPAMQDKRKFYSSNKYNDYMKYIDTGIKDLKNIDFVEYSNNSAKSSGIFNQDGKMNKKQIALTREHLRETESVIWSGVVSFEEKFGLNWCNNFEQAKNIMQSELPKFFKRAGLNPDNIEWFAGLHENTDNRHIHLIFFEKEPQRLTDHGKGYSMGKLSCLAMDEFKANMELCATDFKAREIRIRTNLIKEANEVFNEVSSLKLKSMLVKLSNNFPPEGHLYYNGENMEHLRPQIDKISDYILKHNYRIKREKNYFDDALKEKQDTIDKYCKRNGYKQTSTIGDQMQKDLYRRLGGIVIKQALEIKKLEFERTQLNAKYKMEKAMQRKKMSQLLEQCIYLNRLVEYEAIHSFQEFMRNLEEVHFKRLKEEGLIQEDGGYEMEM